MTIAKFCQTAKKAERYQDRLYDRYESVKLVWAPAFSETGTYKWAVKEGRQS